MHMEMSRVPQEAHRSVPKKDVYRADTVEKLRQQLSPQGFGVDVGGKKPALGEIGETAILDRLAAKAEALQADAPPVTAYGNGKKFTVWKKDSGFEFTVEDMPREDVN